MTTSICGCGAPAVAVLQLGPRLRREFYGNDPRSTAGACSLCIVDIRNYAGPLVPVAVRSDRHAVIDYLREAP